MVDVHYTPIIPLLPLVSFALFVLGASVRSWLGKGARLSDQVAYVSVALMGVSWLLALAVAFDVLVLRSGQPYYYAYPWLSVGSVLIRFGFMVDPMSAVMLIVVATVAFGVQWYSLGYIAGDEKQPRFFAYLSLFSSAMLALVVANTLLELFFAWEIMGLASYLLIGFWYEKPAAMRAAKKAFVVTRVGDTFFFIGMLWLVLQTGTTDFANLVLGTAHGGALSATGENAVITGGPYLKALMGTTTLGWIALLIYGGAVGKSAQFPLHVWLPDAMEGPTPVSALIHAATMVAAGVYLVARMYPIFDLAAPLTVLGITFRPLGLVALVGLGTALMAAYIAFSQSDIKRILAYSTISQLGFMFIGLGCGGTVVGENGVRTFLAIGFSAAMFHLMTHAFFKGLLFLGSGSVIHGTGTQDIWKMGGLWRHMRWTAITFLIGYAALAGVAPLAGFWSKDQILEAAWEYNRLIFWGALLGAGMTAFYMTRLWTVAFTGQWSGGEAAATGHQAVGGHGQHDHGHGGHGLPHESPRSMLIPLVALAGLAAVAGFVGLPKANRFGEMVKYVPPPGWLEPAGAVEEHALHLPTPLRMAQAPGGTVPDSPAVPHSSPAEGDSPRPYGAQQLAPEPLQGGALSFPTEEGLPAVGGEAHAGAAHTPAGHHEVDMGLVWRIGLLSTLAALLGILLGASGYRGRRFNFRAPGALTPMESAVYALSLNKFYLDEIYWAILVTPLFWVTRTARAVDQAIIDGLVNGAGLVTRGISVLSRLVDIWVVDGLVNFSGWICGRLGQGLRRLQTGQVQNYVLVVFIGVLLVIAALVPSR
ncbi:MAG: NADH-quinone oxidoreductase subunit L [Armatimonadetes bacterium]|nr:NADH-quinone oxidoreductase subunit L [Armatimonadota bacterium]